MHEDTYARVNRGRGKNERKKLTCGRRTTAYVIIIIVITAVVVGVGVGFGVVIDTRGFRITVGTVLRGAVYNV